MPHRGHHFAERCSVCDAEAGYHCLRCSTIFCYAHAPHDHRRCDACEAEYRERLDMRRPDPWIADILAATGFAGTVALTLVAGLVAGVSVAAASFVTWGLVRYHELRSNELEPARLRTAFLAERTNLLGEGEET